MSISSVFTEYCEAFKYSKILSLTTLKNSKNQHLNTIYNVHNLNIIMGWTVNVFKKSLCVSVYQVYATPLDIILYRA